MADNDVELNEGERQKCEIWTRVMGYCRPVSEFNKGKKSEFKERKCFSEEKIMRRISDEHKKVVP